MLTLMQIMFVDNAVLVYKPLIIGNPMLVVYFVAFFMVGPIALMSIVTAIMVESSLRTANEDMEAKKAWAAAKRKEMLPKLTAMFEAIDVNASGEVDLVEMLSGSDEMRERLQGIVALDEI